MTGSFDTLEKSIVSLSDTSTNKALQIAKDPLCLQPLLNGEHERLAPIHILPRAITELVYLIEAHHHLNPISILKRDGPWRIDDGVVMLVFEARGIPSRFGEVQLSLVALIPSWKSFTRCWITKCLVHWLTTIVRIFLSLGMRWFK
uniref:Uncharacterized protein n=1 Tax=Tanacetum cinerariifolium TaxID=118510 RepID=A0A6L2JJZ1_TANCI|nr:hypothetical protein [Tanacetum cinerariifolium]